MITISEHNSRGADIYTSQASVTELGVYHVNTMQILDGLLRADRGAGPALVAKTDAESAGGRKKALDAQRRLGRIHFTEIPDGTG